MKLLYVEDDVMDADLLRRHFARTAPHFSIDWAATYAEALARLRFCTLENPIYDSVLTDFKLPDGSGLSLIPVIRERSLPLAVVVITGSGSEEMVIGALKAGANDFVVKKGDYLARLPIILENAHIRFKNESVRFSSPLKVLYAERSSVDIDLTRRHMTQYAPYLHFEMVSTAEEVLERLAVSFEPSDGIPKTYDVILLDYLLPGMNAVELLKELQETRRPDVPVVVITGQGNEEIALQAIRLGAMDYVIKNSGYLIHLPAVIENVCHRAQMIRAQKALKKSEEYYRSLIANVSDIIAEFTLDGTVRFLSPSMERILGYKSEDIMGRKWFDLIHPEDLPKAREALDKVVQKLGDISPVTVRVRHKNGSWHDMEALAKGLVVELGQITLITTLRDITERKRTENLLKENEIRYRTLFESAQDAIFLMQGDTFVDCNAQTLRMFGCSMEQIIGETPVRFSPSQQPDGRDSTEKAGEKIQAALSGFLSPFEWRHIRLDGTEFDAEVSLNRVDLREGPFLQAIVRNVTDRKQAERTMRESEMFRKRVFESSRIPIVVMDVATNEFVDCNPAAVEIYHFPSREETLGKTPLDVSAPVQYDGTPSPKKAEFYIARTLAEGSVVFDWRHQRPSGEIWDAEVHLMKFQSGRKELLQFTLQDITERKRVLQTLQVSEQRYRKIAQCVPDLIWTADLSGRFTYANSAVERTHGWTVEDFLQLSYRDVTTPQEAIRHTAMIEEAMKSEGFLYDRNRVFTFESEELRKDGSVFLGEVSVTLLWSGDGKPIGFIGVTRDISERKRTEQALRESEEKYRNILENIEEGYYEVDLAGNFTFFNDPVCKMLGYSRNELLCMNNRQIADEKNAKELYRVFSEVYTNGQSVRSFEWQAIRKDGTMVFGEISVSLLKDTEGRSVGFRGIVRDVTNRKLAEQERKKLWDQLQQAQKMEAIGTLAGGIAHDFNNILTVIVGCTELALLGIPDQNPIHSHLTQVRQAGQRASELVAQILSFSRQGNRERQLVQPGLIIKEALKMLRSSLPSTVQIKQSIPKDQGLVMADPTHIHQILMNLCTNAAYAMREKGGLLKVTLSVESIGPEQVESYPDLSPGTYHKLTVSDTGSGMEPELRERIFDPYFTTKPIGEGTGLGLAVVYGIVKGYQGTIKVRSEPGKGSLFEVLLPRAHYGESAPASRQPDSIPSGGERILLVDDEEGLVYTMQKMLESLGYQVTARTNSREALEIFQNKPEKFDVLLTDMTMPHLTGVELSKRIKHIRPDLPVILCTGYSDQMNEEKAKALGIKAFVMKPLVRQVLAETLRKVLDGKEGGRSLKAES